MARPLRALDEHLRDENNGRRERIRGKESAGVCVAPVAQSHEELIAEFKARQQPQPAHFADVPDGRFCVSFRYPSDRWVQTHRSATAEDRKLWMRDFLSPFAVDIRVWNDERLTPDELARVERSSNAAVV